MSELQKDAIAKVLGQVAAEGAEFLGGEPGSREKLVATARELIAVAETPVESLLWSIWTQPTRTVAARIAVDLKIFETVVQDDGRPKTDTELAAPTGASPELVKRITRTCASMRMLDEAGPGLYAPNALTRLLTQPEYVGGIIFKFDAAQLSLALLPTYLKNTNYQNPQDPRDGPFQYANDGKSVFAWLADHPDVFQAFHGYVHAVRAHRPGWFELYPVQERLVDGLRAEGAASALVDVGGGTGQVLEAFRAAVPQYTGRLVLQELPEVVAVASATAFGRDPRFELQTHDFFTEQPVKGARAYFMRSILHDWPDYKCRIILRHLKDAMEPGYSRILVNDVIVADQHAAWQHCSLDIYLMAIASSQERTERDWRRLIGSCGLKIAGFYNKGQGDDGLIEIVLPHSEYE